MMIRIFVYLFVNRVLILTPQQKNDLSNVSNSNTILYANDAILLYVDNDIEKTAM